MEGNAQDEAQAKAQQSVEAEVARLQAQIDERAARLSELEREVTRADKAETKAWRAFERAGEATGSPEHDAWAEASNSLAKAQQARARAVDGIRAIEARIEDVRSGRTLERKTATYRRINSMAKDKTPKQTAKDLGVPKQYLSDSGTFRVGMDARLKSDLINAILGLENPNALVKWTQPKAEELFARFPQWQGFLDRKREIVAAKAAAAEKKAAEREQREKDKAEAKAAKANKAGNGNGNLEAQVAAEEAEYQAQQREAKPDPKPARRSRKK